MVDKLEVLLNTFPNTMLALNEYTHAANKCHAGIWHINIRPLYEMVRTVEATLTTLKEEEEQAELWDNLCDASGGTQFPTQDTVPDPKEVLTLKAHLKSVGKCITLSGMDTLRGFLRDDGLLEKDKLYSYNTLLQIQGTGVQFMEALHKTALALAGTSLVYMVDSKPSK